MTTPRVFTIPKSRHPGTEKEFSIYRILGNDLPPRHGNRGALENLKYIIEHEEDFADAQKWWILNRIVDQDLAREMMELIAAAGHHFLVIPFDAEKHFACFLDSSGLPKKHEIGHERQTMLQLEWRVRHKSQQIVNINYARNLALVHGQQNSRWVLPLDGGIMFPTAGWNAFIKTARNSGDAKFVIIPMRRLFKHGDIAAPGISEPSNDEPQIAFRSDAADRFDEVMRYGNRNKAELLSRIECPGPWKGGRPAPWDKQVQLHSLDRGKYIEGGFTGRLPTGSSGGVEDSNIARFLARFQGITQLSAELDLAQARKNFADPAAFHTYSATPNVRSDRLDAWCAELIQSPIVTILEKRSVAPSGDARDFFCYPRYARDGVTPYAWYADAAVRSPSVLKRMGQVLNRLSTAAWKNMAFHKSKFLLALDDERRDDRTSFSAFLRNSSVLAHGAAILGKAEYGARARDILDTWLVDQKTRMNPNLHYAQFKPWQKRPNPIGLISVRDLWLLPQTVDTLRRLNALPASSAREIVSWCGELLHELEKTKQLHQALECPNNISTWAAATSVSLNLFTGDLERALHLLRHAPERLVDQLSPSGVQVHEVIRHRPLHYSIFNLEGWAALTCVGKRLGIDLRNYRGQEGESLTSALRHIEANRASFSDYRDDVTGHDARISTLAGFFSGDVLNESGEDFSSNIHWGLPPLWPLCMPKG